MVFAMKIAEEAGMVLKNKTNFFYICIKTNTHNHGKSILLSK